MIPTSSFDDELDNMHDLHFVDNGTRALFFYDEVRNVSASQSEAIGFTEWACPVRENSFRELDLTKNWELAFSWSSSDHLDLRESTTNRAPAEERCRRPLVGLILLLEIRFIWTATRSSTQRSEELWSRAYC